MAEIQNADDDIRCYIAEMFKALLGHEDFDHFLDGNIKDLKAGSILYESALSP